MSDSNLTGQENHGVFKLLATIVAIFLVCLGLQIGVYLLIKDQPGLLSIPTESPDASMPTGKAALPADSSTQDPTPTDSTIFSGTAMPTPRGTRYPGLPFGLRGDEKMLLETFDEDTGQWDTFHPDSVFYELRAWGTANVEDGVLKISFFRNDGYPDTDVRGICHKCGSVSQSYYVQGDVQLLTRDAKADNSEKHKFVYGIAFAHSGIFHSYLFGINETTQTYKIERKLGSDQRTLRLAKHAAIKVGEKNSLAVKFDNKMISFYINEVLVESYFDERPPYGHTFGYYLQTVERTNRPDNYIMTGDNFIYMEPAP
jgi:hypothetical protein